MYVHGYFLPWLDSLRAENKLTHVEEIEIEQIENDEETKGIIYIYTGEIDESKRPCGYGEAREKEQEGEMRQEWHGTFYQGKIHGICCYSSSFE